MGEIIRRHGGYSLRWYEGGRRRVLASIVLKFTLLIFGGVWCVDANVPYRLMRAKTLAPLLERIPKDFFLANVGLAALLRRQPEVRQGAVRIRFRERYGGEPSVRLGKFGEKAFELIRQLRQLPCLVPGQRRDGLEA